ncbi:Inner membrane protein oxaA [Tripterygium wilfordii]|uniref:Inner membrane protein oxaA n=1 Tax=Tripterygium wilfordii TaxID=458696 RepID=A0A7J7C370_TRIWF|nr:uncharacterized protein LOC119988308 [Tripterygium wilfordii]XP_038689224.1 uncharacterized protein LOC119988308 [Tripterygium wilfordii]KAF5728307.1 Inner membrane protein oxaA [Tripterygium wilfordii]
MNGGSFGSRTGSYGSLSQFKKSASLVRKSYSKTSLSGTREKERSLPRMFRYLCHKRVAMLLLVSLALLLFVFGSYTVSKESSQSIGGLTFGDKVPLSNPSSLISHGAEIKPSIQRHKRVENSFHATPSTAIVAPSLSHYCDNFAKPPPPPNGARRPGPRPCEVCYLPVEQAIASKPSSPSVSPVLRNLTYIVDEKPLKPESHGGSNFGGYPSLKQRNDSFDIKESMTLHCGFVKGSKPGHKTGFDIDEAKLVELEQFHEVIVASAIFGNYDIIQQPKNISKAVRKNIPFYMFIDEETEADMKNSSALDNSMRVGLWRIIVVRNLPYADARRNGKVPKLLLHRIFPNVRFSIWIDGKLQLAVDPYQVLERFLWRQHATFAISNHYIRHDVFEEAEANKAAGKYENSSIDYQIDFYKKEGLTPYSEAKRPILSDVPEGCTLIREHTPITNLFSCQWFNEVDRFTSRDQLSFSTVRDKIMAKTNWSVYMFADCERRNFVIQTYHRDLLEQMSPPPPPKVHSLRNTPPLASSSAGRSSGKNPARRTKVKRSGSRRHRKASAGNRDSSSF